MTFAEWRDRHLPFESNTRVLKVAEDAWNAAIDVAFDVYTLKSMVIEEAIAELNTETDDNFDEDEFDEYDVTGAGDQPAT